MANLTQSELAEALGVQQPAISKLIARGMPTTTIEEARNWRDANSVKTGPESTTLNDNFELPEVFVSTDDNPYATVERLSLREREVDGLIEAWSRLIPDLTSKRNNATNKKQIIDSESRLSAAYSKIDALRKEQRAAIKALQDAQAKVMKMERERGLLISLDAAKELVTKALQGTANAIRKLPDQATNEEERLRLKAIGESLLLIINTSANEVLKSEFGYG